MPVADNSPRNAYVATEGQTDFTYSFEILAQTDLVVLQEGVTLALTTEYTVSGVGDANGGTVTLVSGATADDEIVIYRDMALSRTTDYAAGGQLDPDTLDADLDRILLGVQQLERDIGRSLRLAPADVFGTPETSFVLQDSQARANKALIFDANGAPSASTAITFSAGSDQVTSLAALRLVSTVGLVDGQIIHMTNYYEGIAGGGGSFYWDSASSATDNGGTVIAPDAGGVGRWMRVYSGNLNAAWFGPNTAGAMQSAYDALPSTGGTVEIPPNWACTLTADLTMDTKYAGYLFLGPALITMGTNRVIVSVGTTGAFIKYVGAVHSSNVGLTTTDGVTFTYSGTGRMVEVGDTTAATDYFTSSNINYHTGTGTGAKGIYLARAKFAVLDHVSVNCSSASVAQQVGITLDGTGDYIGYCQIISPNINGFYRGIETVGTCNYNVIIAGTLNSITSGGTIGINDVGTSSGTIVLATEIGACAVAVRMGASCTSGYYMIRPDGCTTDFDGVAGSANNRGFTNVNSAPVVTDAGTGNVFHKNNAVSGAEMYLKNSGFLRSYSAAGTECRILGINSGDELYVGTVSAVTLAAVHFINAGTDWATYAAAHGLKLISRRLQGAQGATVASANDLTLGADGNRFQISGTTQVNRLSSANWQGGAIVTLHFQGSVTVAHNTAASGNFKPIMLSGAGNLSATASDQLTLQYDSTDSAWYEIARTVI